ncbi:MucBP domain-containing protein [Terrisporobacter vanillatitrophus]|uniref:MucBP domain-containing protein n=1 Tax=Terrisporobacter vanillatitrophus TaxID=3058402 RepID=UPI00336994DF
MSTTQTYKCIRSYATIKSKPSLFASNLGTLKKGSLIEVISINGFWAYFKYNNKDAYILTIYIKKVQTVITGSITIQYLNTDTKAVILSPVTNSNLTLKSYTYTAPSIANYTVVNPSTKSVTLTATNPNQEIIFYYKENKIYGTITIKYVEQGTNISIAPSEIHNNVELGTYSYNSIDILGYQISGLSSKSVTLTKDTFNQTIIFEYSKILGSVSVKYLDVDTNKEVASSDLYSNLDIKNYTYSAKSIDGYTAVDPSSKTVTLTLSQSNQEVVFYYKKNKVYGSITIKYVDKTTNASIAEFKVYKDLELGTYSYDAIDILGYDISGESSKSVILTTDNLNQTIIFEYVVENAIEPLDPAKQNEVPYISTYYIKPIIKPDEEVIIDYYITDYYHKEYVEEDFSEIFTVTVRIEGKDDIIVKNLKAGDHSISLGTFPKLDGQEQKFSILCTDQYGRNSHELFNFFLVRNDVPVKEYIMTTQDLTTYNISNTNDTTKLVSTREGLQKLLDDKQAQGFNRLRLLAGTYRIDHLAPIYIPTKFTLDMNGATLKLHEFTGDKALMMELNNTFDSHVINGTIEGDYYNHDYTNSPNNSEWVHGISIGGEAKYSSYENLTVKDITGYGTINGIKESRDNKLGYTYLYPRKIGNTFKLGDIDRATGIDIVSTNRTTCDFRDISGYSEIGYLSVSVYLGYQGNPCGTWNLVCHFYDGNRIFIKSTDAYQYRRISVPSTAKFMRVTILNEAYPTNLSIQLFRLPTNCQFENLRLDNCRAVGMAPQGMNNMLFESCELSKCGTAVTKCALDAEDGWDMMQDATFRKLNFHDNPHNDFLTCAGHNFVVEKMVNGKLYIWSRTKDLVIRDSTLNDSYLGYDSLVKTGCYRFYNNKSTSVTCRENATTSDIILRDSEVASFTKATAYNCTITRGILSDGIVYNSQFINHNSNINTNVYIYNSNFTTSDGQVTNIRLNQTGGIRVFHNCIFKGTTKIAGNGCNSGLFTNCTFDDFDITINQPNKLGDLKFDNCTITYYEKNVSGVDSGFVKLINANASCEFNDCKINCIPDDKNTRKALVWIRGYVNGSKTIFKNCEISKSIGYVIDGYSQASTLASDTNYEVILEISPTNIQLISDKYKNYTYYIVTIIN